MTNFWKQLDHHEWTDVQHGRVRERLIRFMQATRPVGAEAPARAWSWMTFPRFATVGVTALVVLLGGGGVAVAAAQDSAPYETLYPVRIFAETMRTKLTRNPVKKAELVLKFSEERLAEMRTLATMQAAAEGRGRADVVVSGEKRIKAFKRNGQAMKQFAELAEKQIERLRKNEDDDSADDDNADEAAAHLDAVLDASLGILLSVETNAPIDEPVRAVAAKVKQDISPVESAVERTSNEHSAKALEAFTRMPAPRIEKVKDEKKKEKKEEQKDKEEKTETGVSGEGVVRAGARIEAARRVVGRTEELFKHAEEQYGADAVTDMRKAFDRARKHLAKAEELFANEAYQPAFLEAGNAMRVAAHLNVYVPIIEKRAKVLMDEQEQLKLYILPKYLDDQKPAVTTTVSKDTQK